MGTKGSRFGGNTFLQATITGKTYNLVINNFVLSGVKMSSSHFGSNCRLG